MRPHPIPPPCAALPNASAHPAPAVRAAHARAAGVVAQADLALAAARECEAALSADDFAAGARAVGVTLAWARQTATSAAPAHHPTPAAPPAASRHARASAPPPDPDPSLEELLASLPPVPRVAPPSVHSRTVGVPTRPSSPPSLHRPDRVGAGRRSLRPAPQHALGAALGAAVLASGPSRRTLRRRAQRRKRSRSPDPVGDALDRRVQRLRRS
eukprot:SAG11_NODE_1198_length_5543_cov_25.218038_6_plen_213_part_01